ncbi:hypothetical protein ENUP19_0095G0017 [Entamoeba nuttalli]|uniref:Ras guanine nucleotide exchange factor, putative n=2 Tax=Entamoeba nuttalli TaxID=412467 RepID=K2HS68_ENTNP|nr:Ras guanine nucleotide exchange factor, putative [Entamoeba nuttalli P19]EKE38905.1 Ras guanine nucleotide exchange factor, putative [Entamoeba nuttalli P19]|eukprot:XP_008858754.1 Ras guanine nucleotide exchange factor, putative [Entamoeba nuttalli P19]
MTEQRHMCIATTMCPKCRELLCEECLMKGIKENGCCYKCKQPLTLEEIKLKRRGSTMIHTTDFSNSDKLPPLSAKIGNIPKVSSAISPLLSPGRSLSFSSNDSSLAASEDSFLLEYKSSEKKTNSSIPSSSYGESVESQNSTGKSSWFENEKDYSPHSNANMFDLPTTDEYITFTKESGSNAKIIQYATLEKCLQFITSKNCEDSYFTQCFVYSFKLITTTTKLLKLLIILFSPNKPIDMLWNDFIQNIIIPTRTRILALVKMLIQVFPNDFKEEQNQEAINDLIQLYTTYNKSMGLNLQKSFDNRFGLKMECVILKRNVPLLPVDDKFSGILCISPLDFAEQMTLIQMESFVAIPSDEFLNQGWTKKNKEQLTPHIVNMIKLSNKLIHIVQTEIVMQPTYALRSLALFYFITAAETMRTIQNFDGMKAIVTALQSVSVFRLKVSWEMLQQSTKSIFTNLVHICSEDNNFTELRKIMNIAIPPTIPFIGSTLTDLIYTSDGNKASTNNKFNFYKLRGIGNLIKEIQMKQKTSFSFNIAPNVRDFINSIQVISNEDQLFNLSQKHEPKVTEKFIDLTKKPYKHDAKEAKELLKSYLKRIKQLR